MQRKAPKRLAEVGLKLHSLHGEENHPHQYGRYRAPFRMLAKISCTVTNFDRPGGFVGKLQACDVEDGARYNEQKKEDKRKERRAHGGAIAARSEVRITDLRQE